MFKQNYLAVAVFILLALAACVAQNAAPATTAPAAAASSDPERAKIDELFKSYDAAYNQKNLEALLAIYPGLQTDEKEYKKVRWHLIEDPNVYSENMDLQAEAVQINGNTATVKAKRTEKYYALEHRSEVMNGDLNMQNMPAQDPGPHQVQRKHNYDKTEAVVVNLQKNGDNWQIASMTSNKKK